MSKVLKKSESKMENKEVKKPDEGKELKKLLDSYMSVATHKLGRPPSMEELNKMLSENENQEQIQPKDSQTPVASEHAPENGVPNDLNKDDETPEPKINQMMVYYGMSAGAEGSKNPDPKKILYYEDPKGQRVYDCAAGDWTSERPAVLDHLHSRPIQFEERDIVAAIAHGVADQEDYDALDKAGMITDVPRHLWGKMKLLKAQMEDLEKSHAEESEDVEQLEAPESEMMDGDVDPDYTAGVEQEEVQGGIQFEGEPGDDVFSQMLQAALADPSTGMEAAIRRIVHEELESLMNYEEAPEGQEGEEQVLTEDDDY